MLDRRTSRLFRFAFLSIAFAVPQTIRGQDADLVLHGGKVVTVDARFTIVEGLAVKGDRILAAGSSADMLKLAGPGAARIDLAGRTLLPGLADSHVHPSGASMHEFDHPIPEMDTIADVLEYIRSRAAALEAGQWIVVRQVFITRLRDQRYPTRPELDQVAPKNPVLFSTGPDASVNSLALALSGIDKDFRITDGGTGYIEKDPRTGEPTGILRSCTRIVKVNSRGKSAPEPDRIARLKALLADYNSVGLTSITDKDAGDDAIEMYRKLREAGELTCRVYVHASVDAQEPMERIEARIRQVAASPLHKYDNRLWVRGVKSYLDGGMLTGSAYMRKPWGVSRIYSINDPEYRGLLFIQPEKLRAIARLALTNDLQMTAHSVGDGAVHALIDAYASINEELKAAAAKADGGNAAAARAVDPIRSMRPCITHCNFMSPEAIDRMQALGIVADLQPAWLWLDGKTLSTQFGDERLTWFQPYKSLFDRGVVVGGGSDHMQKIGSLRSINPYNPFLGMWIALARMPKRAETALHPEQRLTREQAIRLYTTNNAWLTFEEREKGSLEAGKLADFIILSKDILTCPLDDVKDLEVEQTYVGGKRVYAAR
jgi:hypothetical protein